MSGARALAARVADGAGRIIPAAALGALIVAAGRSAVNVPYWDEWDFVPVVSGAEPFSLAWVWRQHNEHRFVLQKLFLAAWARLTHWNDAVLCLLPSLLIGLGGALLIRDLRRRFDAPFGKPAAGLLAAALGLLVYTPRQWETLFWSFQLSWALVFLALVLFALRFERFVATGRGAPAVAALAAFATLSGGHGLAAPIYLLGHCALAGRPTRARAGLALAAAGLIGVYAIGWHPVEGHPPLGETLRDPLAIAGYALTYAGAFVAGRVPSAFAAGLVVALVVLVGLFAEARRGGLRALRAVYDREPMLAIGVIVAGAIALGRAEMGARQALSSRYTTYSALLAVGAARWLLGRHAARGGRFPALAAAAIAVALAVGWIPAYDRAIASWSFAHRALTSFAERARATPPGAPLEDPSVYPGPIGPKVDMLRERRMLFFYWGE